MTMGTKPDAAGTLGDRPLAHLLVYLLDRRVSGTLSLQGEDGAKSGVVFDQGRPRRVRTADPVVHLGRLLLDLGHIDFATLDTTLRELATRGGLHGELLIERGHIPRGLVEEALREQGERKVAWLFSLPPETRFAFFRGVDFLQGWGGSEGFLLSPLACLWRGVREYASAEEVTKVLRALATRELRFHPAARLDGFRFARDEDALLDVLRAKPTTLASLASTSLLAPGLLERLLYVLVITRQLELGQGAPVHDGPVTTPPWDVAQPRPHPGGAGAERPGPLPRSVLSDGSGAHARPQPGPRAAPASARPASASLAAAVPSPPTPDDLFAELQRRVEAAGSQNYYELLELEPSAPKSAIQTTYLALAKRWHPDRIPAAQAAHRELAARYFARLSEAHQVLSDESQREEYTRKLGAAAGDDHERELIEKTLRAASSFRKAEILLRRGDVAGAREHADAALADDPTQVDYLALSTWLQGQEPERVAASRYADLVQTLDELIAKQENHKRARYYRAQLLKRSGRTRQALTDFRWLVEHDPGNVEAKRELRLYEMRRRSGGSDRPEVQHSERPGKAPTSSGTSMIGRLFKKADEPKKDPGKAR